MPKYILLLRGDKEQAYAQLSPEDIQKVIERYFAWQKRPFVVGGAGLIDKTGRVLRKKDGRVSVTEGPFSESREVMGGFFTIEAASFEEAVELSSDNPHLDFGTMEIREVK
jgi:hypothetical protein